MSYLLEVPRHAWLDGLPARLGDRRPGRGRGPGAESRLRRAVGIAASVRRKAEADRAGRAGTRSRGVGGHDERRRCLTDIRDIGSWARLSAGAHRSGQPWRQRHLVASRRARVPTPRHLRANVLGGRWRAPSIRALRPPGLELKPLAGEIRRMSPFGVIEA